MVVNNITIEGSSSGSSNISNNNICSSNICSSGCSSGSSIVLLLLLR